MRTHSPKAVVGAVDADRDVWRWSVVVASVEEATKIAAVLG
jgi:hypothetical protein